MPRFFFACSGLHGGAADGDGETPNRRFRRRQRCRQGKEKGRFRFESGCAYAGKAVDNSPCGTADEAPLQCGLQDRPDLRGKAKPAVRVRDSVVVGFVRR